MLEQFPHLAQVVTGQPAAGAQPNSCAAYLSYISLLNQVVMLGSQLFHDASVPQHHKYLAHQIALLYQSLNLLQGETKPIRRLVEARFDEIKSLSESQHPYLPVETADWLQEITKLCRQEIKQFPAYVHKRLEPMLSTARLKLRKPGATAAA